MSGQLDLKTFLLSPKGRVGRSPYFSFIAIVAMLNVVLGFGAGFVGIRALQAGFLLLATLLLIWPVYCVTARRLHDLGQPGLWGLLLFAPEVLTAVIIATGLVWLSYPMIASHVVRCLLIFALVVMPGAKTNNGYGPVPAQ